MSDLPERALSLSAPWGYFMVDVPEPFRKPVENRKPGFSHKSFRGHVWVHQTAPKSMHEFYSACDFALRHGVPANLIPTFPVRGQAEDRIRIGGIIGRFEIYDLLPPPVDLPDRWRMVGQFGFLTRDARRSAFVPCKGALGFWRVPSDVLAKLGANK